MHENFYDLAWAIKKTYLQAAEAAALKAQNENLRKLLSTDMTKYIQSCISSFL